MRTRRFSSEIYLPLIKGPVHSPLKLKLLRRASDTPPYISREDHDQFDVFTLLREYIPKKIVLSSRKEKSVHCVSKRFRGRSQRSYHRTCQRRRVGSKKS